MSDIENILKQLRDNYLEEVPEKLQSIESIILNLNKYKNSDDFHELYRHIHSQKGTAGTHGLTFLSAICHQLEDEFMDIGDNISSITEAHTKNWLAYMDLFTEVSEFYKLGYTDTSKFEDKLKTLMKTIRKSTYSCLLVDTKSATLNIITEVLKQHSIHTTIFEDGYEALGRLLVNKYDMLIC
jgi:chemotaxis protein histidine kinase CheA